MRGMLHLPQVLSHIYTAEASALLTHDLIIFTQQLHVTPREKCLTTVDLLFILRH